MALAVTHSRCRDGTAALPVMVETHLSGGLPSFTIVGLPEVAVRESRERVRSALLNSGFEFPQRRITVNLAPADIPKEGTRFDLAIALGILAASGQIPSEKLAHSEFLAELALDGSLRGVGAALAAAIAAVREDRDLIVAPRDANEAALVTDARVLAARCLQEVCDHLLGILSLTTAVAPMPATFDQVSDFDMCDVVGQFRARRALEIAAAGGHNILMIGPPGTGKTMLASRLPSLLPAMTEDEALESAAVYSACGLPVNPRYWRRRSFRAPHHSCSAAALVGGGRIPRPGEISLAHHGVLFLDELPEYDRRALEALREPLESASITISRSVGTLSFPARFQLVAAMNPCPCGYDGDAKIVCRCSPERIARYRAKVSGPLSERIDMHLDIPRQAPVLDDVTTPKPENSEVVRQRVAECRQYQLNRRGCLNAKLNPREIERHGNMSPAARSLLTMVAEKLALSLRGCHKVLRMARTIADMDQSTRIDESHLAEAASFRSLDLNRPQC